MKRLLFLYLCVGKKGAFSESNNLGYVSFVVEVCALMRGMQLKEAMRRVVRICLLLLAVHAMSAAASVLARGERSWQPERTWVFVVGTLSWKHREMWNSFPQKNRRDAQLVQFFKEQGVPADHIVYLSDKEATQGNIQRSLAAHLSRAGKGDMLFLYYTGHGYKSEDSTDTYLASYDAGDAGVPGWSVNSIPASIERYFMGDRAFLALDNCYSGTLAEAVTSRRSPISYAVLTSSTSTESSTGNWTFTEILLGALRGRAYADSNSDGEVTLGELAGQASDDMLFAERQRSSFAATGTFSPQTILAQAERKADARVGERVEVRSEGDWFKGRIIDASPSRSLFLVHYYGYEEAEDEWVSANRIRRLSGDAQYAAGQKVEVEWEGDWYAARILQVRGGLFLIHYQDYGEEWDEWVEAKRIRSGTT